MPLSAGSPHWERRLILMAEALAVVLAVLALVRIFELDTNRLGILVVTFLPWFLLPAYLLLGIGLGARRLRLIAVAILLVVAHISWILPELPKTQESSAAARAAPTFRMATANVLAGNQDLPDLLDVVLSQGAHVVALQEMGWRERSRLGRHPMVTKYPHRYANADLGIVLLSQLPIESAELLGRGFPVITVTFEGEQVQVMGVHTSTPLWHTDQWIKDLAELTALANELGETGRVVLLGDFNSTMQHRQFRDLLDDANLTDSHRAQGAGWGATWPQSLFLGPQLRLDHVLVSQGVEVTHHGRWEAPGSDHQAVYVWLKLLPNDLNPTPDSPNPDSAEPANS